MIAVHVIIIEWILCFASLLVLLLRIFVRTRIVKVGIQREEIMLIISQVLFFVWISMDTFTISKGFMNPGMSYLNLPDGFHAPDDVRITVFKTVFASSAPYYICLWLIKFSLLSLYYRLIPKGTKTRIVLHFTAGLAVAASLTIILVNILLCQPISLNWTLDGDGPTCYSSTAMTPFIISVLLNLVVDLFIFALPFSVIRKLKTVGKKQKYGLIATFSVGIFTIAVIVVRAVIVALSGSISVTAILTAIECFTSMAVACMPVMRPLFKVQFFKFRGHRRNSTGSSGDKLSGERYNNEDLESTVSFNENGHNSVPLTRLEKPTTMDFHGPLPPIPPPELQNTIIKNHLEITEDDFDENSPTSSPALLQQVRLQQEQEQLHPLPSNSHHVPYHMAPFHHSGHNSFNTVPSYVSASPLPIPPPPHSHNQEEYITPSYILNEPLPNPVI